MIVNTRDYSYFASRLSVACYSENNARFRKLQLCLSPLRMKRRAATARADTVPEIFFQNIRRLGWKSLNIWEQLLTIQNSIREEIKSRLRSGNACYHSVQNLLSCRLLSRKLKIKIYRTIILPVVL